MAAIQTSSLVNGVWTTRTVNINDVLKQQQGTEKKKVPEKLVKPPVYGLLTRTVIESPVFNWILPARIRHKDKNDVVFIGDNLVQLRELHADSRFRDIASKSDFGSRIRSALVIGSLPVIGESLPPSEYNDDEDIEMRDAFPPSFGNNGSPPQPSKFPPQYIVLALESGDIVFLYARDHNLGTNEIEFVMKRHSVPGEMLRIQPGAHLAVDPSGRYMTLSCFQHLFAIFELKSELELLRSYRARQQFDPVKRERYMSLDGILNKMEFLHPSLQEPDRIILLMIVVNKGKTKMFVYVWDAGNQLETIRPQNPKGHRVHCEAELPLLLIPLRINSHFMLVSEDLIMLCKDVLEDMPTWSIHEAPINDATENHFGSRAPIFTAWARPRRMKNWAETHDPIYIAREDGRIKLIEIESENEIEGVGDAGTIGCNIGRAFAYVDFDDQAAKKDDLSSTDMEDDAIFGGDILVVGGDMSNGGTFSITARENPIFVESISNWSPTLDFVAMPSNNGSTMRSRKIDHSENNGSNGKSNGNGAPVSHGKDFCWPDRIFTCSGRGKNGAIVELRHGLEARISLQIDCQDNTIRESWVLPDVVDKGLFFLVSSFEDTSLLHLWSDQSNCPDIAQTRTWLDLSSPTILAEQVEDYFVQVTKTGVFLSNLSPNQASIELSHSDDNYSEARFPALPGTTNVQAALQNEYLFMTTRIGLGSHIEMRISRLSLKPTPDITQLFDTITLESEPTCLELAEINGELRGIYAFVSKPGYIYIINLSGNVQELALCRDMLQYEGEEFHEDVCHSLKVIRDGVHQILLCGFRDGSFRTYLISTEQSAATPLLPRDSTQLGTTAVTITSDHLDLATAFIRCDDDLYRFTFDEAESKDGPSMSSLHRIWHTDEANPQAFQPFVHSVTRYSHAGHRDDGNLLITSDSKLLLASLDPRPKAVPRTLPIGATPTAVIHSATLNALVVAVLVPCMIPSVPSISQPSDKVVSGKTNILFIDPNTGLSIAEAMDGDRNPTEFMKGLGKIEKIMCIGEWHFRKNGKAFMYILVGLNTGKVLVISANKATPEEDSKLLCWTTHIIHQPEPVYSFATSDDAVFICTTSTLYWYKIDLAEKKIPLIDDLDLPSPGVSIEVEGELVNIVTARHSLIVVKFNPEDRELCHLVTDQVSRHGLDQLAVPKYSIRLVSDRSLSVSGLWHKETSHYTDAAISVFEAELTTAIVKFQTGTSRRKFNKLFANDTELFEPRVNTTQSDSIFGIGIDGSLQSFEVLPESIWIVLRYIQNTAMHSRKVCPLTYDKVARDELGNYQIEPLPIPKTPISTRHVNGDILSRCKNLGRNEFARLLNQDLPDDDDYDSPETRKERFAELMGNCMLPEAKADEDTDFYWEAYKLMCWYLRPVM